MLGEIVQSSNEYARPVIDSSRPIRHKSILNKWKEVTLPEIKAYLAYFLIRDFLGCPPCIVWCYAHWS